MKISFIHAPNSRAPLRISYNMFRLLMTYHQVMPPYLDFVFPFGHQIYPKDANFSGLRAESPFRSRQCAVELPELGRSTDEWRLCYNLRSVEPGRVNQAWCIRQAAIYQTLDLKTGRALWVVVKGNSLIRNRVKEACQSDLSSSSNPLVKAFASILATHLLMCDWSGENWRWYVNDLDLEFQSLAGEALADDVNKTRSPIITSIPDAVPMSPKSRSSTMSPMSPSLIASPPRVASDQFSQHNPAMSFSPMLSSQTTTVYGSPEPSTPARSTWANQATTSTAGGQTSPSHNRSIKSLCQDIRSLFPGAKPWWRTQIRTQASSASDLSQNGTGPSDNEKLRPDVLPPTESDRPDGDNAQKSFTFKDLQEIQYIEEKTQEALLALKLNANVLDELRDHYRHTVQHPLFPKEILAECQDDMFRFDRSVLGVRKDLELLQSRTQNLLQLLTNRKSLVSLTSGITLAKLIAMISLTICSNTAA